jgi:hypothetical protein
LAKFVQLLLCVFYIRPVYMNGRIPFRVLWNFSNIFSLIICSYEGFNSSSKRSLTFIGMCIVIYFYSETNKMHQLLKFILFRSSALHVSGGLSVHHQESKTVHTSGICKANSSDCLLAGTRWNSVPSRSH